MNAKVGVYLSFVIGVVLLLLSLGAWQQTSEPDPSNYWCDDTGCWTEECIELYEGRKVECQIVPIDKIPEPSDSPFWLFIMDNIWVFVISGIGCLVLYSYLMSKTNL